MNNVSLIAKLTESITRGTESGIVDPDGKFTPIAVVVERAKAIGSGLRMHGLVPGDRVLFAVRPGATAICAMLGVAEAGGTLIAADLGVGEKLFAQRMSILRPRWIIAESVLLAASRSRIIRNLLRRRGMSLMPLEEIKDATTIHSGFRLPSFMSDLSIERVEIDGRQDAIGPNAGTGAAEAPVLIVFTSGTTAKPKAVVHSRRSMASTLDIIHRKVAIAAGDVMYAREIHLILPALMAGARAVIPPYGNFSAARMLRDIEQHHVTHFFGVTSECQTFLEYVQSGGGSVACSLKHAFIGAAPVHAGFLERFQEILPPHATAWSLYGMTEMLPVAAITVDEKLAYDGEGDIIGTPVEGAIARIASDGELVLRGPNLFTGYFGQSPLVEHFTGDLATLDNGRIVLLGRKKDMMIRGRTNIYPALHEPIIDTIAGVRRSAMVGLFDEERQDEVIVLVIEPEPGTSAADLENRVRHELRHGLARIDEDALPDEILIMTLPESGRSRKIDKAAIRAIAKKKLQ